MTGFRFANRTTLITVHIVYCSFPRNLRHMSVMTFLKICKHTLGGFSFGLFSFSYITCYRCSILYNLMLWYVMTRLCWTRDKLSKTSLKKLSILVNTYLFFNSSFHTWIIFLLNNSCDIWKNFPSIKVDTTWFLCIYNSFCRLVSERYFLLHNWYRCLMQLKHGNRDKNIFTPFVIIVFFDRHHTAVAYFDRVL